MQTTQRYGTEPKPNTYPRGRLRVINGRASIEIGKHITVEDSTLILSLVEDSTLHYVCGQFTEHRLENAATTSARPFGEYELPASGTES